MTARALNQAIIAQAKQGIRNRWPAAAKHVRQGIVRDRQRVSAGLVVRHQQPAGNALANAVKAIAGSTLGDLRQLNLDEAAEQQFEARRTREYPAEDLGLDPQRGAWNFNDHPDRRRVHREEY
jgi:hypothetical protein